MTIKKRLIGLNHHYIGSQVMKCLAEADQQNMPDEIVLLWKKARLELKSDVQRYELERLLTLMGEHASFLVETLIRQRCSVGFRGKIRAFLLYLFFSI